MSSAFTLHLTPIFTAYSGLVSINYLLQRGCLKTFHSESEMYTPRESVNKHLLQL